MSGLFETKARFYLEVRIKIRTVCQSSLHLPSLLTNYCTNSSAPHIECCSWPIQTNGFDLNADVKFTTVWPHSYVVGGCMKFNVHSGVCLSAVFSSWYFKGRKRKIDIKSHDLITRSTSPGCWSCHDHGTHGVLIRLLNIAAVNYTWGAQVESNELRKAKSPAVKFWFST